MRLLSKHEVEREKSVGVKVYSVKRILWVRRDYRSIARASRVSRIRKLKNRRWVWPAPVAFKS